MEEGRKDGGLEGCPPTFLSSLSFLSSRLPIFFLPFATLLDFCAKKLDNYNNLLDRG